jgi:hypothetical protein
MSDCLHCDIHDLLNEQAKEGEADLSEIAAKVTEVLADLILMASPEEQLLLMSQVVSNLGGMVFEKSRVEMWRRCCRSDIAVSASFVWRCLSGSTMAPFPHPAHRTGRADFPHPALGQDLTPSPTARRGQAQSNARARSARRDAGVDKPRPCVA